MDDSATTQRDARLRKVSDTTMAVAAGAALGTAVVIGYAVLTHGSANASEAAGTQQGGSQAAPQQGSAPESLPDGQVQGGQDQGAQLPGGQDQGGQVQGGFGGGAPTTSGGS